ncbi:MAG TPA: hypothetical protein VF526_12705 [Solirubrobacteraceae bacterium]|jgi:hypothetical protein
MSTQPNDPFAPRGETPSGLPEGEDEIPPLGGPAEDDDASGRGRDGEELPGLPTSEPDTAG